MNTSDIATRLPIFISYGHDDDLHGYQKHEKTVLKIKEALEARGHKIWIDKEGIREGTDWRRKIYDGIRNSQLFLAFVSQKSIDSEYCQTEIRIAVGAPQNLLPICPLMLENVTVPQSISHIQTVNFVYDENDPAAFEEGLKKVTDWIDRDEHVVFCQEMEGLRKMLGNPESFEARMRVLMSQPFVGRKWLLEKLNEWDKGESRLFGIIGGPGFGKSIFAANLRSLAPEKVVAAQFIEWDKTAKYAPKQIIKSLAFQLAARISQYRELLIDAVKEADLDNLDESSLFDKLLSEPLAFENPNNTYWVILDALDEAATQDGQNPFVQTLMRNMDQLPKWLKFIVTSRPDATVVTYLKNCGIQFFDTDAQILQSQHNDMMEYLHEELKECSFNDGVLKDIIAKSQGMFLYLHFVCQDIKQHKLSAAAISQLPVGIDAIYQQYFDRQFGNERRQQFIQHVRPILCLCGAAFEPLSLDFLTEALKTNLHELRSAINMLGTLVFYKSEGGRETFSFVHKSIWDWFGAQADSEFRITEAEGNALLAKFCLGKINSYSFGQIVKDANSEYPLHYVIQHLIKLHSDEGEKDIWRLLGDEDSSFVKKQFDCFGNYTIALEELQSAIVYYMNMFKDTANNRILPRICRLILTMASTANVQGGMVSLLFKDDITLEQAFGIMKELPSEIYYEVAIYLLGKTKDRNWDVETIIRRMEDKCGGQGLSINSSVMHLLFGQLYDALPCLTGLQLVRVLKVLQKYEREEAILVMTQRGFVNRQFEEAYWFFYGGYQHETILVSCQKLDEERARIEVIEGKGERFKQLIGLAESYYLENLPELAEEVFNEAEKHVAEIKKSIENGESVFETDKWSDRTEQQYRELFWFLLRLAELRYYMGKPQKAFEMLSAYNTYFSKNYELSIRYALMICKCKGMTQEALHLFLNYLAECRRMGDHEKESISQMVLSQSNEAKVKWFEQLEDNRSSLKASLGCLLIAQEADKPALVDRVLDIMEQDSTVGEYIGSAELDFLFYGPFRMARGNLSAKHLLRLQKVLDKTPLLYEMQFAVGGPIIYEAYISYANSRDSKDKDGVADNKTDSQKEDITCWEKGLLERTSKLFDYEKIQKSVQPKSEMTTHTSCKNEVQDYQQWLDEHWKALGRKASFDDYDHLFYDFVGKQAIPPDLKMRFLSEAWKLFNDKMKTFELADSKQDETELIVNMESMLNLASETLGGKLAPFVDKLLEYIEAWPMEWNYLDMVGNWFNDYPDFFRHPLLKNVYPTERLLEITQHLADRIVVAVNSNSEELTSLKKIHRHITGDCFRTLYSLIYYYLDNEFFEKAKALLDALDTSYDDEKVSDDDKISLAVSTLSLLIENKASFAEQHREKIKELLQHVVSTAQASWADCKINKYGDKHLSLVCIDDLFSIRNLLQCFVDNRTLHSSKIMEAVIPVLAPIVQKTGFWYYRHNDEAHEIYLLHSLCSSLLKQQFTFDEWYTEILDHIRNLHSQKGDTSYVDETEGQQNHDMRIVLDLCFSDAFFVDGKKHVRQILSLLGNEGLTGYSPHWVNTFSMDNSHGIAKTAEKLLFFIGALKEENISRTVIKGIVSPLARNQSGNFQIETLCVLGEYLIGNEDFVEKLFKKVFDRLIEGNDQNNLKELIALCPELNLGTMFVKSHSVLVAAILELRQQLEEEEIGRKRYARELGKLLADVDDDTLKRFTQLERAFDDNIFTKENYVQKLNALFPKK